MNEAGIVSASDRRNVRQTLGDIYTSSDVYIARVGEYMYIPLLISTRPEEGPGFCLLDVPRAAAPLQHPCALHYGPLLSLNWGKSLKTNNLSVKTACDVVMKYLTKVPQQEARRDKQGHNNA
ncbi:hypothetical protein J6590_007067 [Homalodisca vitripennis]|nr:hypothetical protein J6590_007067 [Homalodisca vitripennis]